MLPFVMTFTQRRRRPARMLAIAAASMILAGLAPQPVFAELTAYDRVRVLESARSITDAELTDQDGQPFELNQLRGRVALIFFGFTHCPDVCPLALDNFRRLRNSGEIDPEKVAFVMISVDGDRDSPPVLKEYLSKFSPDFIGLTGDPVRIKPIAAEFSAAFYKGSPLGTEGDYLVSHSPQVFVVDPRGRLRAEFYNATTDTMAAVTLALLEERGQEP